MTTADALTTGSLVPKVWIVVRNDETRAYIVHVGSTLDESQDWCDRRLAASKEAGLDVLYHYPDTIEWANGRAQIGDRGYLTIQEWDVDGDIWGEGILIK
jgi:hypothetical protein